METCLTWRYENGRVERCLNESLVLVLFRLRLKFIELYSCKKKKEKKFKWKIGRVSFQCSWALGIPSFFNIWHNDLSSRYMTKTSNYFYAMCLKIKAKSLIFLFSSLASIHHPAFSPSFSLCQCVSCLSLSVSISLPLCPSSSFLPNLAQYIVRLYSQSNDLCWKNVVKHNKGNKLGCPPVYE